MSVSIELAEATAQNRRYRVFTDDGVVESVLYRTDSLCISTQVGCGVGCPFCASGAQGFGRNLRLEELVAQVEQVRQDAPDLSRVTLSGVGEPLHNSASLQMLDWCRDHRLSMSLTTTGGPLPRLRVWLEAPHRGLTISVHAGTERTRRVLVPHGPPLEGLFRELEATLPTLTSTRRKKTALAYLLVPKENDSPEELRSFARRAMPLGLAVHLYASTPVPNASFQRGDRQAYEAAYDHLRSEGLKVRMSSTARLEANGGCGTLVALRAQRRSTPDLASP